MAPRLLQFARAVSLCHGCVHLEGGNPDGSARCAAFDTIPAAIWTGAADHRQRITGDRGITFRAAGAYGEALEAAWSAQRLVASATLADEDAPDADGSDPEAPGGGDEQEDSPGPVNGDSAAMEDAPEEEWHAVVVVEGVETGDRRYIELGSLTWRELPLPISWQTESPDHGGHAHSVEVARITRWERRGGELHAWGHHIENAPLPAGTPSFRDYLEEVGRAGLSADLDDADIEIDWPDEDESDDEMVFPEPELVRVVAARVSGATVVTIPAFQEAYIETLTPP